MDWIENENKVKGEMSDKEFQTKINAEAEKRKDKMQQYGRDGHFQVYEENFFHRGIPFRIKINRYYQIGVPLDQVKGMNEIGKWSVLERDDSMKELVNFIDGNTNLFERYEFLWADTLHIHNEGQDLKQMVAEMVKQGKEDIDWLLDEAEKQFNKKVNAIRKEFEDLKSKGAVNHGKALG